MKSLSPRCELAAGPLGSLRERFAHVTEFRKGQGKRHRLPTVLAIVACAKMAGVMGGLWRPGQLCQESDSAAAPGLALLD